MITQHTIGPRFGLPEASPFVMKAEMTLKLAGLPYEKSTRGFGKAPKGKLPYIRDGETVVADSTLIRLYLEQKYQIDLDRGLSPRDRGIGWAVEKMLEDHLYWIMVYWRWLKDDNFARGPKAFFKRAPALIRPLVENLVKSRLRGTLHRHGIGRHSEAETTAIAARGIEAMSNILGDNPYFLGQKPCAADATVFAFVAGGLAPAFNSPVTDKLAATTNLVAYRDRMMAEFYPGF
jgi:glutathione S-transferase